MRSDAELLAAYAASGDEAAFAGMASRHAAMVYRVCLSALGDAHEAEDVSQATFLVLSRKARNLRRGTDLAAWLYGTARNVARWAARNRATRRRNEEAAAMAKAAAGGDEGRGARGQGVDTETLYAELDRLPLALRQAVLLRYAEGLGQREAAEAAGCPQGTLGRRAAEGLERLRARLAQRGSVLGVGAVAGLLEAQAGSAVPASLLPSILAVPKLAAAGAAAGAAGGGAVALAEGAMKAMFWIKVKLAAAVLIGAAAVGGGGAAVVIAAAEPQQEPPKVEVAATDKGIECKVTEILHMALDRVRLSAGSEQGVRPGFEFDVLSADGRAVATVKADVVEAQTSRALVTGGKFEEIKVGDTARTRFGVVPAQPGEKPGAPAEAGKVAWGEAVGGLQAGLIPLGGGAAKGWGEGDGRGMMCPTCRAKEATGPGHPCDSCKGKMERSTGKYCNSCAVRLRVCARCGADKPWGAAFAEGEPIRLEMHFRDVGKSDLVVYDGGPHHWTIRFTNSGGGEVWTGKCSALHEYSVKTMPLKPGEEACWDVWVMQSGSWTFTDARARARETLPDIKALPPGKYTVTASYEHPVVPEAKASPYWHGKVTTGAVEIEVKPKGAAPAARKRSLEVKRSWTGVVANEALSAERPKTGFVADQEGFAKLWKAWRGAEAVPEVAFGTELVLVETAGGPNIPAIDQLPLDENGNLLVLSSANRLGGGGFGYRLAVVPREGIKSVRGAPLPGR